MYKDRTDIYNDRAVDGFRDENPKKPLFKGMMKGSK